MVAGVARPRDTPVATPVDTPVATPVDPRHSLRTTGIAPERPSARAPEHPNDGDHVNLPGTTCSSTACPNGTNRPGWFDALPAALAPRAR